MNLVLIVTSLLPQNEWKMQSLSMGNMQIDSWSSSRLGVVLLKAKFPLLNREIWLTILNKKNSKFSPMDKYYSKQTCSTTETKAKPTVAPNLKTTVSFNIQRTGRKCKCLRILVTKQVNLAKLNWPILKHLRNRSRAILFLGIRLKNSRLQGKQRWV